MGISVPFVELSTLYSILDCNPTSESISRLCAEFPGQNAKGKVDCEGIGQSVGRSLDVIIFHANPELR